MASTPFKVVSWSPLDPITDDKLDAMVNNDNWLRDNSVTGVYVANGIGKTTGIRIVGGLCLFTASKSAQQTHNVGFGQFFSAGCKPIVTTACIASAQRQIWVTIDGPGSQVQPTRDGFQITVNVNAAAKAKMKISRNFYVSWHALGY